jgi:hypothetical protein
MRSLCCMWVWGEMEKLLRHTDRVLFLNKYSPGGQVQLLVLSSAK